MKKNEIDEFNKHLFPINILIGIVVLIVLLILGKYDWALGYLLGSTFSYLIHFMHSQNAKNFASDSPRPKLSAFLSSSLRLLLSMICLFIAFLVPGIDLIATFIGLVVIKVVIFILSIVREIIDEKNRKVGEEKSQ